MGHGPDLLSSLRKEKAKGLPMFKIVESLKIYKS
jgi:hypothetical protein